MQTHPDAAQLKELQDSIFREKVLRARSMTDSERLDSALEQIDFAFVMMRDGIRMQFPELRTDEEVENVLRERLDLLRRMDDRGLFVAVPPADRND
jgi:hypothetical protein